MSNNKGKKPFSIVFLTGIVLAVIVMFFGAKTDDQVITLVGMGIFILTMVVGIFMGNGDHRANGIGKTSGESKKNAMKYEPLLFDERTKQDPEVQRLLQYTSVQKVFFDPEYLKTVEAQNDPYVRELMEVLDNIISSQTVNGVYPPYPNQSGLNGTNAYVNALMQKEIARRNKERNKPRRIAGAVLAYVGLGLFFLPFFIVFIASVYGWEVAGKMASFLFTAAPFGMVLIVIGSIIWKR